MILDTCPSPPTIAHGSHDGNNFTSGTSVTYSCNKQYVLEGSAVIRCVRRQWIGKVPVCRGIDFEQALKGLCYVDTALLGQSCA